MNVFQAMQVCHDIKKLRKNKKHRPLYHCFKGATFQSYTITVFFDGTRIEASRNEKHRSDTEFVPFTKWNCYIKRAGNYKMVPKTFTVRMKNSGILPHAPKDKNFTVNGLPARIIYRKMRKLYKKSQEKQR